MSAASDAEFALWTALCEAANAALTLEQLLPQSTATAWLPGPFAGAAGSWSLSSPRTLFQLVQLGRERGWINAALNSALVARGEAPLS